ncbi:uncharacterized protein (DUF924 family) [Litoreibacter halocynthiae]|uniref:Uncharacterized protein (DUF924 family) n=1 Tax=Litoreibacter halocynthiae TaxID=1242689 RepID=A0A4R7LPC2_9RHOB|nr:DUF924 family protein [Litoreibacter halocynthiae]TDT77604.1 uncharacterized protein (DUF924 family) [Litoreibacter halocynthiae]
MSTPEDVLAFWLDEQGEKGWYAGGEALDAEIRNRFEPLWQSAMEGGLSLWMTYPSGVLAYIILTDQFPRNMFRGSEKAFASDRLALSVAKTVISKNWDLKIDEPARQFFYLPLMHSESVTDQERCVRLFLTRMPKSGEGNLLHAKAHREVIRKFGRFPYRNDALHRRTTQIEDAYINDGGYGMTVEALKAAG